MEQRYGAKIWGRRYGTEDMKAPQALPEINSYKLCNETYLYNYEKRQTRIPSFW